MDRSSGRAGCGVFFQLQPGQSHHEQGHAQQCDETETGSGLPGGSPAETFLQSDCWLHTALPLPASSRVLGRRGKLQVAALVVETVPELGSGGGGGGGGSWGDGREGEENHLIVRIGRLGESAVLLPRGTLHSRHNQATPPTAKSALFWWKGGGGCSGRATNFA